MTDIYDIYDQKMPKSGNFGASAARRFLGGLMTTLHETVEDLAIILEEQAQTDEDAARKLRKDTPAGDDPQNAWRQIEAAALERSARRYRGLAATMRWRVGQADEESGPGVVANLRRRVRRLRAWLIGLAVAYVGLLAGFLALVAGRSVS